MRSKKFETSFPKAKDPKEKYGGLKQLLEQSKVHPENFYDDLDTWLEMLASENNFIKWAGMDIIGHLSLVDTKNKIDKHLGKLFGVLNGGKMISANHAVYALGLIALNKPKLRNRIVKELLLVSKHNYETTECRNIVTGKILLALGPMADHIRNDSDVLKFVKKACGNTRPATKKKAEVLLKKLSKLRST